MISPRLQFSAEDRANIDRLSRIGQDAMAQTLAIQEVAGQPIDIGAALKASILAIHEASLPNGFATEDHPNFPKP